MNKSVGYALLAVVLLALWLISGVFSRPETAGTDQSEQKTALMSVAVLSSSAKWVSREVVVQGRLESWQAVDLRAETAGLVKRLRVDRGDDVTDGQVLLELQVKDRPLQIDKANAEIASKELMVKAMRRLQGQGLQAETNLKQAQADLAAALAEKLRLQLDLDHTRIAAPFAGSIEQRAVEVGSYVEIGDQLLRLVDNSRLKAVAWVTQQNRPSLQPGQSVRLSLLDGREAQGALSFISHEADGDSRSFRVEAGFENKLSLPAGASIEMRIAVGENKAHFLSPSVLTLNDQGVLGVKTVNAAQEVDFVAVDIVRSETEGVWLAGLPDQVTVIIQGQGFVKDGVRVTPVEALPDS